MRTGKECTGKGGFSQAGEQILPQKLIVAEEMHKLKGLHVHEVVKLLLQKCCRKQVLVHFN